MQTLHRCCIFLLVLNLSLLLAACGGGSGSGNNTAQADLAPAISNQPHSTTTIVGGNASFSVQAGGTPALTYQWQKNGVDLAGATSASLQLSNLQLADNDSRYTVLVSNRAGSVRSASATLLVQQAISLLAGDIGGGDGNLDGVGRNAHFYNPGALAFDTDGNLYVADSGNLVIRKITPQAVVSTIAGSGRQSGAQDDQGKQARFASMTGMVMGPNGKLYLADYVNQRYV